MKTGTRHVIGPDGASYDVTGLLDEAGKTTDGSRDAVVKAQWKALNRFLKDLHTKPEKWKHLIS